MYFSSHCTYTDYLHVCEIVYARILRSPNTPWCLHVSVISANTQFTIICTALYHDSTTGYMFQINFTEYCHVTNN